MNRDDRRVPPVPRFPKILIDSHRCLYMIFIKPYFHWHWQCIFHFFLLQICIGWLMHYQNKHLINRNYLSFYFCFVQCDYMWNISVVGCYSIFLMSFWLLISQTETSYINIYVCTSTWCICRSETKLDEKKVSQTITIKTKTKSHIKTSSAGEWKR